MRRKNAWPAPRPIEDADKSKEVLLWLPGIGWKIGRWYDDRFNRKPRPFWLATDQHRIQYARTNPATHFVDLPPDMDEPSK